MKAREIAVTLPHPALPGADWADCFEVTVSGSGLTAEIAARLASAKKAAEEEKMKEWQAQRAAAGKKGD